MALPPLSCFSRSFGQRERVGQLQPSPKALRRGCQREESWVVDEAIVVAASQVAPVDMGMLRAPGCHVWQPRALHRCSIVRDVGGWADARNKH